MLILPIASNFLMCSRRSCGKIGGLEGTSKVDSLLEEVDDDDDRLDKTRAATKYVEKSSSSCLK